MESKEEKIMQTITINSDEAFILIVKHSKIEIKAFISIEGLMWNGKTNSGEFDIIKHPFRPALINKEGIV